MLKSHHLAILFIFLVSCAVKKEPPTRINLKPLKISAKPKVFQTHPDRSIDIFHTAIHVSFDWKNHLCMGKEEIIFSPYSNQNASYIFDAKNFNFEKLSLTLDKVTVPFEYTYENQQLIIQPKRRVLKTDTLRLLIEYVAYPDSSTVKGSRAIQDAKGLYFINTDNREPYKPMQLWTQGETESNSNWFVTVDKPYEKMTFDISITVADSLNTLSNGLLTKSQNNDNFTRTDFWTVTKPMSAYLVMMAVGRFNKIKDKDWNGKEVSYFLEPAYTPYAMGIFNHTREMIDFYSEKLGTPYPWQKYSQVVVHDYVSGAMENTSATLHGEFVQKNNRELIDNQNDGIVAHELFHQWFGDLVTCHTWSHLTLNEGFATFGEQLWFGHKYGKEAELKRIYRSMKSYLRYAKINDDPIVNFYYSDKEEMFNSLTYQKGARVLNLLKFTLGEDNFYAGIRNYLSNFSYQSAQIEDLRHELEKTSGKDLRFFFYQWYLKGGHPKVEVSKKEINGQLIIEIKQIQKDTLFSFPFQVRTSQGLVTKICHKKDTRITVPNANINAPIYPDPNGIFIGEIINKDMTDAELKNYYSMATNYIEKMRVLESVKDKKSRSLNGDKLVLNAINDRDPDVSHYAMTIVDWEQEANLDAAKEDLKRIATLEKNPKQKSQAIYILSGMNDKLLRSDFETWLQDSSYQIAGASLLALKKINPGAALSWAKKMELDAHSDLFTQLVNVYAEYGDSNLTFFEDELRKRFGSERNHLIKAYGTWAERMGEKEQKKFWNLITERAKKDEKDWTRLASIYALHSLLNNSSFITENNKLELSDIIDSEKSDRVRRQLIIYKIIKPKLDTK